MWAFRFLTLTRGRRVEVEVEVEEKEEVEDEGAPVGSAAAAFASRRGLSTVKEMPVAPATGVNPPGVSKPAERAAHLTHLSHSSTTADGGTSLPNRALAASASSAVKGWRIEHDVQA